MKIADLFIIFLPVLSLFVALAVLFRAWRYRPGHVVTSFLWLMVAIAWWLLSAIIENMSTNVSFSIFWMKMCYLGITTLPVIWFVFTLQYSDRGKRLTRPGMVLLFVLPAVTLIMVWTNDINHMIWKSIVVDTSFYPSVKTVTYNAWFWVHAIYSYILLLAGTINLSGLFFRTSGIYRKQTGILLLASFTPLVANLLFITGIGPSFSIDPTPMAFVVTGVAFLWGLSRTQLLHMMPVAYETIFRSMADGVIIIDKQDLVVETNPAAQRILKLNKTEMIGKTLKQVIPGYEYSLELKTDMNVTELTISLEQDRMERFYNLYMSSIVTGQRSSGHIVLLHDDTERRKAENEFREKAVLETELNERKKMEVALADEVTRRRILVDQSRDGIVILDQDGHVYEANQRFADMLGYSLEEVSQLHVFDWEFLYPREQVIEMLRTVDEKGDHFETQHRRKDGTVFNVEISTNGAMFAGHKLIFCVCRDITERKKAEEKLKQAMADLEQSSACLAATNKEMESFSYSVSHDLRSPLRSIDGFSQALLEDYQDKLDEHGKEYLNRLRSASQKMGELIDGLLKLSRLTRSEMHQEIVDLSALAEEIITRFQETQPKRHTKFIIGNGLTARGDPQLLRVLLENLLGNAWKFTMKIPQAEIEFDKLNNGNGKTFFVKDNGAGFDMAYADKLFSAFQRLHDTTDFPGTGIGLATVQRIINRHGGSIRAEGVVDKGATFYFTLE